MTTSIFLYRLNIFDKKFSSPTALTDAVESNNLRADSNVSRFEYISMTLYNTKYQKPTDSTGM